MTSKQDTIRKAPTRRDPDPPPAKVCVIEARDAEVKGLLIALGVPAVAIRVVENESMPLFKETA